MRKDNGTPEHSTYVQRLLERARYEGQWYCRQPDAAALCFDVLSAFPSHHEAADLVYELFCDEWLIYDNRNAIQQNIDEWDDRPWQQRRRWALSFRFMSRWEALYGDRVAVASRDGPPDVADLLREGKMQLLHTYCLGDEQGANYAWPLFEDAFRRTKDRHSALMWVGRLYADLGFFADSSEVLNELCHRYLDEPARRLWVEVAWWRDNAHRLPWLPPSGDGSRYQHMMEYIHPRSTEPEMSEETVHLETRWAPSISPELDALFSAAMADVQIPPAVHKVLVDWRFLDLDDGLPGELPEWARKMLRRFPGHIPEDMVHRYRWSRPIAAPTTPPRRPPHEPPFNPGDLLEPDDEDDDSWADLDDDEFNAPV